MTQLNMAFFSPDYHTLKDSDFVEDVAADIQNFVKNQSGKRVLVFPPFNNFRRCLIHQLVEHHFEDLKSFSIGEADGRRTVVCFNKDFKSQCPILESTALSATEHQTKSAKQTAVTSAEVTENNNNKKVKRPRTMPSVSIYRPPAARKLEQNANLTGLYPREVVNVPSLDKTKLKCAEEPKELNSLARRTDHLNGTSVFRNAISSIRTQNKVPGCRNNESTNKKNDTVLGGVNVNKVEEPGKNAVQNKQRRPDIQVYVPKGRRGAVVSSNNSSNSSNSNANSSGSGSSSSSTVVASDNITNCKSDTKVSVTQLLKDEKIGDASDAGGERVAADKEPARCTVSCQEGVIPEKCPVSNSVVVKISSQAQEEKSSKQSNGGSHLSLESPSTPCQIKPAEKNSTKKTGSEVHLNPDECDWESMFDDTGECLDPSLLEQLTSAVGDVTIEKPKSAYNDFKTKSLDVTAEEFPHVIEIYNFPPEFQLQDLMTVFSQFKNSGFEIKWVDDTHALGVFSSSAVVSEVLSFYHPFVKTRLLKEGTALSKMKARRSAEFLLPYKPRPDTCPALARRLVTGALGVKLPTSREEREAEKKLLTKAREKKKLEAKQKEDAWEGTFS